MISIIKRPMQKILSEQDCFNLIQVAETKEWFRITKHCQYEQVFIEDEIIEAKFQTFFGQEFAGRPLMKILKLSVGDELPLYSGDYDSVNDDSFSRYVGTNFIIETYLNDNFIGGNISLVKDTFDPKTGYGIIQKKSQICSISPIMEGTAYIIFCYIKELKSKTLL